MSNDYLHRQSGLITDEQRKLKIGIVGAGGIGSHTALALARMGFHDLYIYDDDTVSLQNCSSQGFDMNEVGMPKVNAMRSKIMRAVRAVPKVFNQRVTATSTGLPDLDILIMAVDSMEARKTIFDTFGADLVINPSMGGEYMNIDCYDMSGNDNEQEKVREVFNKAWFSDDDAVQESCTSKATIYTTLLISGFICKIVKDYAVCNDYINNMTYDIGNNSIVHMYSNTGENLL